ncbi:MAG: sigma 54-interacting transcriptional regulator [Pirellulales bacterium]|nr:sigma 54-interacting transcriptional regulator [Pirellulales bacterium]
MPQPRIRATQLAHLFQEVTQPVYVLDEQGTIVFCNEACVSWLGGAAEGLVGRRCAYHSSEQPKEADTAAARLCPPPEAMAGRPCIGTVGYEDTDGTLRRRRVRFCPIVGPTGEPVALVAVVEREDVEETDVVQTTVTVLDDDADANRLHEQIMQFRQEAAGRYRMDRLVGRSPVSRLARAQVELAVASRVHVQIVGPPGSGREHTARAIHYASDPDRQGSLIPLACATLTDELIRSTIGALTPSSLGKMAARSTLLLNDADQLSPAVHAELIAWLKTPGLSLRVIATTRTPLSSLAEEGTYARELALLLSPIIIVLPALAERREDLPVLAQWFLEELNAGGGKQVGGFSSEALELLDGYAWPGNVDELAEIVAHAHRQAERPQVLPTDLPERIHWAADAAAHPPPSTEPIHLDDFLGRIELELITRALAESRGNKARAARLLGLTRPRLYRRLEQLGMDADGDDSP